MRHRYQSSTTYYGSIPTRMELTKSVSPATAEYAAVPGPYGTPITLASSATPIVISSTGHGLQTGDRVAVGLVGGGNEAANGVWRVDVLGPNQCSLRGSVGAAGAADQGYIQKLPGRFQVIDHILLDADFAEGDYVPFYVYAGDASPTDDPLYMVRCRNRSGSHADRTNGMGRNNQCGVRSDSGFIVVADTDEANWDIPNSVWITPLTRLL